MDAMEVLSEQCGQFVGNEGVQISGRSERSRSSSRGPGPGEDFRASQSLSGLGLGNAFQSQKDVAGALSFRGACSSKGAAPDSHGLARVKVESLAFTYCFAGRTAVGGVG